MEGDLVCGRCYARAYGAVTERHCPTCGADELVPAASPRGAQIIASSAPPTAAPVIPAAPVFAPTPGPLPRFEIPPGHNICSSCYEISRPKNVGPGVITGLMIVLTAVGGFFFFPLWILAVLFAIYMAVGQKRVCRACGSSSLVPPDTERGQELLAHVAARRDAAGHG